MNKDNEPLVGGSYLVKDGVRTLTEEPTKDHPEGNRARTADGKPVPAPDETHANPSLAATSAERRRGRPTEGAA
jgi:hypothetical protein